MIPTALTIAGSDPSGAAGIGADLKTFSALSVYGMAVVTALTAQNTERVSEVFDVGASVLAAQLDSVMGDISPDGVKIGMLASAANVDIVSGKLAEYDCRHVVLDPVMKSSSGTMLLDSDAQDVLCDRLFPLITLVIPNLDEAEALTGDPVRTLPAMEKAARQLHDMGASNVLVKGGHLGGETAVDVFFDGEKLERLEAERLENAESHGTGCVLSSAITAYLASGDTMSDALRAGKSFTLAAIRNRLQLGHGRGLCDPLGLTGPE